MKIILAGISPVDTLIIKNIFKQHNPVSSFEWLSVESTDADALIFLERFLLTPTIENAIHNLPDRAVVGAVRRDSKDCVIPAENGSLKILDLEKTNLEERGDWVNAIIHGEPNAADFKKVLASLSSSAKTIENPPKKTVGVSPASKKRRRLTSTPKEEKEFPGFAILARVRSGRELFLQAENAVIYLSPKERRAWVNHEFDAVPPFDKCRVQNEQRVVNALPNVLNLNQWLWESLWNSSIDCTPYIDPAVAYRLKRWPQPRSMNNRSLPLRIAGAIQRNAASTKQLAEQFTYQEAHIAKFLYTMELVGFVEKKGRVESSGQRQKSGKKGEKLGIFARIRQRLNLGS